MHRPGDFSPQPGAEARTVSRLIHSAPEHDAHKAAVWALYVSISFTSEARCVLNHPDYQPDGPTFVAWQPHIADVGTAAYRDVTKYQNTTMAVARSRGIGHLLSGGNQQTFIRSVFSKRMNPAQFDMLTIVPGEWHFCVHVCMAMHILHWAPFLSWFVADTGGNFFTKTVIEKWDSVVRYDDYRFFHETMIVAILQYLKEVVPERILRDNDALFANASDNAGRNLGCL